MQTLSPHQTVDPFGKVNFCQQADGTIWVRAYILMERTMEGAHTGIAIDGSGTMMPLFGAQRRGAQNLVAPFVQQMCAYLASKLDALGSTTAIYWATGADGKTIEDIGTLTADQASKYNFAGPLNYGNYTCLLPALRYFIDRFADAKWGMYVFITDGRLDDLAEVKQYTTKLAQEIAHKQHNDLKLVIIGVGQKIDERQMIELDDLDTGTNVDLWDHKIASSMQHLAEVFTEVVNAQVIVAPHGRILDWQGQMVKDYRDVGLPALLEFTLPAGSPGFILDIGGNQIKQELDRE